MARWVDVLVAYAQANLTDRVLEALWSRGVSDEQIRSYKIGYLNQKLPPLEGATEFMEWCWRGKKLQDVFVLPMTNALGQVKGVQFRHVDRVRKGYMDFFVDDEEPSLFGLAQAMPSIWQTERVFLVEGAFDLMPVQRVFPNVIPTMTASVSQGLLRFLKRTVKEVWIMYDTDAAGYKGGKAFVTEHASDFDRVGIVKLPRLNFVDGRMTKDPSDLWELLGDERLGVYLRKQQDY
jgi:DNA primase